VRDRGRKKKKKKKGNQFLNSSKGGKGEKDLACKEGRRQGEGKASLLLLGRGETSGGCGGERKKKKKEPSRGKGRVRRVLSRCRTDLHSHRRIEKDNESNFRGKGNLSREGKSLLIPLLKGEGEKRKEERILAPRRPSESGRRQQSALRERRKPRSTIPTSTGENQERLKASLVLIHGETWAR